MKTFYTLLLVFAVLLPGVTMSNPDSRTVETTRIIPATPQQVLDAFLDDGGLKAWWKVSRSLVERKQGGIWSITWDDWGEDKTQHAWVGEIDELTSDRIVIGRLLMIEPDMPLFGPLQLEIRAEPVDGGTSLTVLHRGYQYGDHWDRIYELVVNGWDHVLGDMQTWATKEY
ncbi:MAG: SRPBCC domain-containing protein [Woeseiaceae bacterium]|nr:SRPBCC domain-containing protein [Woeseiaceae bacterium]